MFNTEVKSNVEHGGSLVSFKLKNQMENSKEINEAISALEQQADIYQSAGLTQISYWLD